jgi:hypothetical protein
MIQPEMSESQTMVPGSADTVRYPGHGVLYARY